MGKPPGTHCSLRASCHPGNLPGLWPLSWLVSCSSSPVRDPQLFHDLPKGKWGSWVERAIAIIYRRRNCWPRKVRDLFMTALTASAQAGLKPSLPHTTTSLGGFASAWCEAPKLGGGRRAAPTPLGTHPLGSGPSSSQFSFPRETALSCCSSSPTCPHHGTWSPCLELQLYSSSSQTALSGGWEVFLAQALALIHHL